MATSISARQQAEDFFANPRFNQTIEIPLGGKYGDITVSYAIYGHADDEEDDDVIADIPVVLMMPGMFASRCLGNLLHFFGRKHRVKILSADRFGFGSTTNVHQDDRVKAWVQLVPRLLQALDIKHVALMSHSAGTIYSLNTLWHCRQFLHPEHPQVFFFAPWVDDKHSDSPLMLALRPLPNFMISWWNGLARSMVLVTSVPFQASSGVLAKLTEAVLPRPDKEPAKEENEAETMLKEEYDLPPDLLSELGKVSLSKMFGEETVGVNSEAIVCLKKGAPGSWDEAEDLQVLVKKLAVRERDLGREDAGRGKLAVKMFFGETDIMTGKAGQKWFEGCWKGENEDWLDVEAKEFEGCDHDSVLLKVSNLKEVFGIIRQGNEEGK